MKTLLILRHAKSSWDNMYLSDFERPLSKRGKDDAPRMGEVLRREELVPDLIISSAAKRAVATAQLAARACEYENEITFTRDFYHADPDSYIEVLSEVDDEVASVMVVGHNPGIEELVEQISGVWERMPTAALAQIQLPIERWGDLTFDTSGELITVWRPKELAA
ncbi:MAG: histidine phosphatase family protein [Anaerolineales bacterium]|nr:histidine phosphatase family protein [Anaerolineales bacterium]